MTMREAAPTDADRYVGTRIRLRRRERGLTLIGLADLVDVAPQQIQKYETGQNRISVSRLVQVAAALGTPAGWFLEGLPTFDGREGEDEVDTLASFMAMPEAIDIMRVWPTLSIKRRTEIAGLIEKMGWAPHQKR